MNEEGNRHFCIGPGLWDTLCGVEGDSMTLYKNLVTCSDCLRLLKEM